MSDCLALPTKYQEIAAKHIIILQKPETFRALDSLPRPQDLLFRHNPQRGRRWNVRSQ